MCMHVLRTSHTWLAPRGTHAEYGERPQQPTGSYNINKLQRWRGDFSDMCAKFKSYVLDILQPVTDIVE